MDTTRNRRIAEAAGRGREKIEEELQRLKARYNVEMRGRMIPTPRALKIKAEINETQDLIDELDRKAAENLAIANAPIDDMLEIIAIPLLADVMNDVVAGVDGCLLERGCSQTIFSEYTAQIRRAALAMVDTLARAERGLPLLLDIDDTLVDAVKKKLISFIKQRLKIKDPKKTKSLKKVKTVKTISELNALIPQITALVLDNAEIGERFQDGNGCDESWTENYISYDDDGWSIEVSYQCSGIWDYDRGDWATPPSWTLRHAKGEVTDLTVSHYDETTDEGTSFAGDDLSGLWGALNRALKMI